MLGATNLQGGHCWTIQDQCRLSTTIESLRSKLQAGTELLIGATLVFSCLTGYLFVTAAFIFFFLIAILYGKII